jgi:hypothetical protein
MRNLPPINATFILRITSSREDLRALMTETDQHDLNRLLRYRLAVLEAALRRVEELRRKAAKAVLAMPRNQSVQ